MRYIIPGDPIPWKAHKGYGKRSYSPNYPQKKAAEWEIFIQHSELERGLKQPLPPLEDPVRIDFVFEMPIPKSKKKLAKRVRDGEEIPHATRPDLTNLKKFSEDCLTGVVIKDDNINVEGYSKKIYSLEPKTIITITPYGL